MADKGLLHTLMDTFEDWSYTLHRPAGQYGKSWDKDAELLAGSGDGGTPKGILHVRVIKGKALPKPSDTKSFQQHAVIRVGAKRKAGDALQADTADPGFSASGYFKEDLYSNTQVEISVFNKGKSWDSLVGRVIVPVRELHDVRTFNGWLCLSTDSGDPAGFVYVACLFRREGDIGYEELENEYLLCNGTDGATETGTPQPLVGWIGKLSGGLWPLGNQPKSGDVGNEEDTTQGPSNGHTIIHSERNSNSRTINPQPTSGTAVSGTGLLSSDARGLQPPTAGATSGSTTPGQLDEQVASRNLMARRTGLSADSTSVGRTSSSQSRVALDSGYAPQAAPIGEFFGSA